MKWLPCVFLSVLFMLLQQCSELDASSKIKDTRIVGGVPTSIAKVRYLVNLRRNGFFICGGSLVSRRFVVTAAHCVYGVNPRDMSVVGGSTFLRNGVYRPIAKIMIPSRFKPLTMNMDVAVIKLRSRMYGRFISPIKLCSLRLPNGASVRVSGWGLTAETSPKPSQRVRTTIVRLRSHKSCERTYQGIMITRTMICASVPGIRDSCSGDSGGPLVYNGQLCGIVSWGVGCARADSPGVYTSINQVKKFIARAMRH